MAKRRRRKKSQNDVLQAAVHDPAVITRLGHVGGRSDEPAGHREMTMMRTEPMAGVHYFAFEGAQLRTLRQEAGCPTQVLADAVHWSAEMLAAREEPGEHTVPAWEGKTLLEALVSVGAGRVLGLDGGGPEVRRAIAERIGMRPFGVRDAGRQAPHEDLVLWRPEDDRAGVRVKRVRELLRAEPVTFRLNGPAIRAYRQRRGWTLGQFSKVWGWPNTQLCRIERGKAGSSTSPRIAQVTVQTILRMLPDEDPERVVRKVVSGGGQWRFDGFRLRRARLAIGVPQHEMAAACGINVAQLCRAEADAEHGVAAATLDRLIAGLIKRGAHRLTEADLEAVPDRRSRRRPSGYASGWPRARCSRTRPRTRRGATASAWRPCAGRGSRSVSNPRKARSAAAGSGACPPRPTKALKPRQSRQN